MIDRWLRYTKPMLRSWQHAANHTYLLPCLRHLYTFIQLVTKARLLDMKVYRFRIPQLQPPWIFFAFLAPFNHLNEGCTNVFAWKLIDSIRDVGNETMDGKHCIEVFSTPIHASFFFRLNFNSDVMIVFQLICSHFRIPAYNSSLLVRRAKNDISLSIFESFSCNVLYKKSELRVISIFRIC